MNIRKMFILIKKDTYMNYSIFVLIILAEILYCFFKLDTSGTKLVFEFLIFILFAGTGISYLISYNLFNREYKDKTLKTLKALSFTNADIYFSKLILGYFSILLFVTIPSFIFIIITGSKYSTIPLESGILVITGLTVLFLFEVSFFTFFFACFDKITFIAISQISVFFLFFFIFKFESITGVKPLDIIKNNIVINIFKIFFYLLPVILILFVFTGYKLYDKNRWGLVEPSTCTFY